MQRVEAPVAVSVSELKDNPAAILDDADGESVAVLDDNRVMAYLVPAEAYEAMVEHMDDIELIRTALERANETAIPVAFDDL